MKRKNVKEDGKKRSEHSTAKGKGTVLRSATRKASSAKKAVPGRTIKKGIKETVQQNQPLNVDKQSREAIVSIVMGSASDLPVMKEASEILKQFDIPYEVSILSAHRTPADSADFAKSARDRGIQVIIAGAGGAAHLAGVIAAYTEIPVIGVPVASGPLNGQDALYSIVQMPKGVPVATVAIGNAWNAGILAAQIIASGGALRDEVLLDMIRGYKDNLQEETRKKNRELR